MTYSLNLWTSPRNENDVRIYINGTTRSAVYFKRDREFGRTIWSSKAKDTPAKLRTGNHYGKVDKDGDAAREVAAAFGVVLGDDKDGTNWASLIASATGGVQVEG